MKPILIATIGTRDLSFQIKSDEWYNVGDDRMQNGEIIGEQTEVIADLNLPEGTSFRQITQYIFDNIQTHNYQILPVIIGKLLLERGSEIEKVYLIATDQKPEIREREKDTIYSAQLIKHWITQKFHHLNQNHIEIITLGQDGINPSNFEEMFQWWRKTWRNQIQIAENQPIWLCLKGGVGQAAEASRISGLSLYGTDILFFEFLQNRQANRIGIPSDYTEPLPGTNYLWDRTQQQVLKLLHRYDYAEVLDLLQPYINKEKSKFGALPNLLKAGILWNQGKFENFHTLAKSSMKIPPQLTNHFWWMAYEQAYLAVVRLEQQNTTEALFHSFRAVEGLVCQFILLKYKDYIQYSNPSQPHTPYIEADNLPSKLQQWFEKSKSQRHGNVGLHGRPLFSLLELSFTTQEWNSNPDIQKFIRYTVDERNTAFHGLGGLQEQELYQAWGKDIKTQQQWKQRVLSCLNFISRQNFSSLADGSIFSKLHNTVVSKLENAD